jgi:hypothetical protein
MMKRWDLMATRTNPPWILSAHSPGPHSMRLTFPDIWPHSMSSAERRKPQRREAEGTPVKY